MLVDLDQFLTFEDESSVVADAVRAQVRAADVLLLSKSDLVDADRIETVRSRLAELAPGVPTILADSAHAIAGLVNLGARRPVPELGGGTSLFDQYRTSLVPIPGTITRADLDEVVESLPASTIRAKGIVQIETGEMLIVQVVGNRRTIEPLPMAEATAPTDLVVIEV